ncbi:MAG TPA: HAD family phosphatase [Acidobacteriaceae bacterium]|nr:HAD family phosphatase [Acidobacteriaceae bacterium]
MPLPTQPPIEVVLFDYGQVLSGPANPTAWAHMRSITALDEPRLHAAYWAYRHDYDRGTYTGPAYWQAVATHAGITLAPTQLASLLAADIDLWTDLNQPMVDFAQRLQRAGHRTAILSNIGDAIAEGIRARLPWLSAFEHATWSHALFLAKPEPEIFHHTAAALRTPPVNILFIDDREDNIAAAHAIGMQTIHYTNHPAFEEEMRRRHLTNLLNTGLPAEAESITTPSPQPTTK